MAEAKEAQNPTSGSLNWDKHASMYEKIFEPTTWLWGRDALTLAGYPVNFVDKLPNAKNYLEVACGSGQLAITAATMGFQVTATDYSKGMVDRLQNKIQINGITNIETKVADGQTLEGIPDAYFDVIISNFGYFMFPDRGCALKSAIRVLRPGGQVILSSWDSGSNNIKMILYMLTHAIMADGETPSDIPNIVNANPTLNPVSFKEELIEYGFINTRVYTTTHAVCARTGYELVEAMLDNGGIGPMLANRNVESVKLSILEFCRLTLEGRDPFAPNSNAHLVPGEDNKVENHPLYSSSFSIPFTGHIAIANKSSD